jgi:hypothetical protein
MEHEQILGDILVWLAYVHSQGNKILSLTKIACNAIYGFLMGQLQKRVSLKIRTHNYMIRTNSEVGWPVYFYIREYLQYQSFAIPYLTSDKMEVSFK